MSNKREFNDDVSTKINALKLAEKAYLNNIDSINKQFATNPRNDYTLNTIEFKRISPKNNKNHLFTRKVTGRERGMQMQRAYQLASEPELIQDSDIFALKKAIRKH